MNAHRTASARLCFSVFAVHALAATGCERWRDIPEAQKGVDRIAKNPLMRTGQPEEPRSNLVWAGAEFKVDRASVIAFRPEYPVVDWNRILELADRYDVPRETLEPWSGQQIYYMYTDRYQVRVKTKTGAIEIASASISRGGELGPPVVSESASDEDVADKAKEILKRLGLFPRGEHETRVFRGDPYTTVELARTLDGLPVYPPGNYCLVYLESRAFRRAKLLWPKMQPWKKVPIRPPSAIVQDFKDGKGVFNLDPSTKGTIHKVELGYCTHGGRNEALVPCYRMYGRGGDINPGGFIDALPADYLKE